MTTEDRNKILARNAEILAQMEKLRQQLKDTPRAQPGQTPPVVAGGFAPGGIARVVAGKPMR